MVPPGEGAGRLLDVLLRVVTHAEREEFHHLAGVVLVGCALHVAVRVQPHEHRRVLAHVEQKRPELAEGVRAQRLVLGEHQLRGADLRVAGGEVVVPEQRELLAERVAALEHRVQPPHAEGVRVVVVLPRLGQQVQLVGRVRLAGYQAGEGLLEPVGEGLVGLGGRRAEGGAAEQVRDPLAVPRGVGAGPVRCPGVRRIHLAQLGRQCDHRCSSCRDGNRDRHYPAGRRGIKGRTSCQLRKPIATNPAARPERLGRDWLTADT